MQARRRKASVKGPTDVSLILHQFLESPQMANALQEADLIRQWETIVGKSIASQVQPIGIDQGVLLLRCPSSTWRSEVNFAKKAILQRIQGVLGTPVAKDFRFL